MTLADTNFWLALSFPRHQFHQAAGNWFGRQSAKRSVLFCRSTQQSFLRLLTTDAVAKPYGIEPMTNAAAWDFYNAIAADPRCALAPEPGGLEEKWAAYARMKSASPKLWMDAYIAAFAVTGGYELITTDEGFRQFKDLKPIILTAAGTEM
jgi:toxin-antitoxin system PIN domain toxin